MDLGLFLHGYVSLVALFCYHMMPCQVVLLLADVWAVKDRLQVETQLIAFCRRSRDPALPV